MSTALPSRSYSFNAARTTATRLHVIGSRISSDGQPELALRGEFDGNLDAAKHHATTVAYSLADRYKCAAVCVVINDEGQRLFSFSTWGAAR